MPIREYRCEFCTKWHLTSKKRRKGVPTVVKKIQTISKKETDNEFYTKKLDKNKRIRFR